MMDPEPSTRDRGWLLFPAASLILCTVQLAATFPGELIADSTEQLHQAMSHQYGDWHPPIMALVWSWLIGLTGQPGSLLILQQALHWMGFGLIADGCRRAGMPVRACLLFAAGAFPLFLFYDKILVKDVEMASAYIAAFGFCCWFLIVGRTIPWWGASAAAVLLLYGTLTRTNAVFAVGPLVCIFFAVTRRLSYAKVAALSAIVAAAAVPLSNIVNHRLIGARPQDSLQSLQIYDLVGIEVRSGDTGVLGGEAPPLGVLQDCYTSYWWDPFSVWGVCAPLRPRLAYLAAMDGPVDTGRVAARGLLWRRAILAHPLDYIAHRLSLFNSSVYFVVPALHFRFSKAAELQGAGARLISEHDIRMDYIKKNLVFWPVVWLTIGSCAAAFLSLSREMPPAVALARLLMSSALLYSGAYAVFGVATDVRYYYWPIMAILVGVILAFPQIRSAWQARPAAAKLAGALLLVVVAVGYAARIRGVYFA